MKEAFGGLNLRGWFAAEHDRSAVKPLRLSCFE